MRTKFLAVAAAFMFAVPISAQAQVYTEPATQQDAIKGTMVIDFGTRINASDDGVPQSGAVDTYETNLEVFNSIILQGTIERRPWLPSGFLGVTAQEGYLAFDLRTILRNPANPTATVTLGAWIGAMELDGGGKYFLAIPPSGRGPMRITGDAIGNVQSFVANFGGQIQGRRPQQAGLAAFFGGAASYVTRTYSRVVNGQTVSVTVEGADPMAFENAVLASGPLAGYPESRVNGSIDYDPEEGIWYVDTRVTYNSGGEGYNDRYSGTIRWIEDPNREANGLGHYEVNVRLNEAPASEAQAFAPVGVAAEEAFFFSDVTIPGFTGTVDYRDTFQGETVIRSMVDYHINANAASRIQTMNFAKILLLIIGPFNDE